MRRLAARCAAASAALAAVGAAAHAASTVRLDQSAAAALEAGNAEGVVVGPEGLLTLAPPMRILTGSLSPEASDPVYWSGAVDSGGALWLGGSEGRVLRIPQGGPPEIAATLRARYVTALAAGEHGAMYAATSPGGVIYSLSPGSPPRVFNETGERYVWALAVGRDGTVYAATGERGRLLAITPAGEDAILFDSDEAHLLSLAFDRQGRLLVGTAGRGLLLRVDSGRTVSTLHAGEGREITAIAAGSGGEILFASVLPEPFRGEAAPELRLRVQPNEAAGLPAQPVPPAIGSMQQSPQGEVTAVIAAAEGVTVRVRPGGPRSELLRLAGDGSLRAVWNSDDETIQALAAAADGSVWLGTGSPARIRRLARTGSGAGLVARLENGTVSALAPGPGGALNAILANPGGAWRLDMGSAPQGRFTSTPVDGGFSASWGVLRWEQSVPPGGRVAISTRTGPSPVPDSLWSPWRDVGGGPEEGRIASAPGRYLQWRVSLAAASGASPRVEGIALSARPANRAPWVREVRVPDRTAETPAPAGAPGAADSDASKNQDGAPTKPRMVQFDAGDPDGDALRVTLIARGGTSAGAESTLTTVDWDDAPVSWSDAALPEGRYVLTVRITDERSNPEGSAATDEAQSAPFLVDRTPPGLKEAPGPQGKPRIVASDALSPIFQAEYSLDGTLWQAMGSEDGLLDQTTESLVIPSGRSGSLTIRVSDAAGNESRLSIERP